MNVKISQYNAYDQTRNEQVSLIDLDDDEWFKFIQKLINNNVMISGTDKRASYNEIEQIDINFCAPFCTNEGVFSDFNVDTEYLSVISGEIGKYSLRLWLGENGIRSSLMNTKEAFKEDILKVYARFSDWWSKIPLEPQIIDDTIMTKKTKDFGINHVQLWIKSLDNNRPKSATDKFIKEIKLWVYAHEIFMAWQDDSRSNINNNGSI